MKKKILNPVIKLLQFVGVVIGVALFLAFFSALADYIHKGTQPREPIIELRSYHSNKGLVEIEDGFLVIKPN